jgi:hypothetical protein
MIRWLVALTLSLAATIGLGRAALAADANTIYLRANRAASRSATTAGTNGRTSPPIAAICRTRVAVIDGSSP